MFTLENELQKRLAILDERNDIQARIDEIRNELIELEEKLVDTDYEEIAREVEEIKALMGVDEEEAEAEEEIEPINDEIVE